jgi:hypothetical protein
MKQSYLELRPVKPKVKRIKELLSIAPYAGPEKELDIDEESQKFYRTDDLLDFVQASTPELLVALKQMRACTVNGKLVQLSKNAEVGKVED